MTSLSASRTSDFTIVGGGIVGLAIALEAKRRYPDASVTILEKEASCGEHASGRNSGVLHAGFYYTADSLKARFTAQGCQRMTEYCLERGLGINRCGKLVVPTEESELAGLDELLRRGRRNGVEVVEVSAAEAREIEPRARVWERALWSPNTAAVDPVEVVSALVADACAAGVQVRTGTAYRRATWQGSGWRVETDRGSVTTGYLINAAGVYADRVARGFGFSANYRILPFKGLYLYSDEPPGAFRTHIYPVPELRHPFLGVHFTLTVDGRVKIGPTATPAFWREHYSGPANLRMEELVEVVGRELGLFIRNDFGFRELAVNELRKHWRPALVRQALRLADGVELDQYRQWGRPGIRAQLINIESKTLEMDFRVEGDDRSFHVLNAVSPAFTSAFPFADYVWQQIESGGAAVAAQN